MKELNEKNIKEYLNNLYKKYATKADFQNGKYYKACFFYIEN